MSEQARGPEGPGQVIASVEHLAAAREQRGMTQSEIAQRLKLHPRQLAALERGDWSALPGRAFVRGCVRAYGRLLEVDVEPLLAVIGAVPGAEALRATTPLDQPLPRRGSFGFESEGKGGRLRWMILGLLGVALVIALARGWELARKTPQAAPEAAAPAAEQADAPPEAAASAASAANVGVEPEPGSAHQPLFVAPAPAPAGSVPEPVAARPTVADDAKPAAPVVTPAPAAAGAATVVPVRVTVTQEAWVEIRQPDGKAVFMGMVKPGAPLETTGPAPLALTIGNAEAVTLEAAGQAIDLRPLITAPGNVARVRVP